jgi:hypothetical protein
MRVALLVAVILAGCSLSLPPDEPRVRVPLGQAPGSCAEVTDFAYAGDSTLRDLGFDDTFGEFGDDFERRGRFWVTLKPVDVEPPFDTEVAAARARDARGLPPEAQPPERADERMLCVRWTDGNPIGLVEMAIPADWSSPSN